MRLICKSFHVTFTPCNYIHIYILHTYIHTYIHPYIHAYMHAYMYIHITFCARTNQPRLRPRSRRPNPPIWQRGRRGYWPAHSFAHAYKIDRDGDNVVWSKAIEREREIWIGTMTMSITITITVRLFEIIGLLHIW